MESSIWSLFSRRKGTAGTSVARETFQATTSYDDLPAGVTPEFGAYPGKPVGKKFGIFGQGQTKSSGAWKNQDSSYSRRTSLTSRTKSVASTLPSKNGGTSDKSRNDPLSVSEKPSTSISPAPQLPNNIPSGRLHGLRSPRHLDLLTAVGSHHSPSASLSSDPYSKSVADHNSFFNSSLDAHFRRSSVSTYSQDVAERKTSSSASHKPSLTGTSALADSIIGSRPVSSLKTKSHHPHSSAEFYANRADKEGGESVPPGMKEPSSAPLGSNLRPQPSPVSSSLTILDQIVPRNTRREGDRQNLSSFVGQEMAENQSINRISASTETSSPPTAHRSSHHRAGSSLSSNTSVQLSSIFESKHQSTGFEEHREASELDNVGEDKSAQSTLEKLDPIHFLRTSVVGSDGYKCNSAQAVVAKIIDERKSNAGTAQIKATRTPKQKAHSEIRRSTDRIQNATYRDMDASWQFQDESSNESDTEPFDTGVGFLRDFDLQAEFEKLNRQRDQIESGDRIEEEGSYYHYSLDHDPFYTGPPQSSLSAGHTAGSTLSARDFGLPPVPVRQSTPSPDAMFEESDMEGTDEFEPPAVIRHKDPLSLGRTTQASSRSTSRNQPRYQPSTYTLRATISDEVGTSSRDHSSQHQSIASKRSRSVTLETLARTPLNDIDDTEKSTISNMTRLKELLAQLPPTRPSTRAYSIRSDGSGPPSFPKYSGGRPRTQTSLATLVPYEHKSSPSTVLESFDGNHSSPSLRNLLSEEELGRLNHGYVANPASFSLRSLSPPPVLNISHKDSHPGLSTLHDFSPMLSPASDTSYITPASSMPTPTAFMTPPQIMSPMSPSPHGQLPGDPVDDHHNPEVEASTRYWAPGHTYATSTYSDRSSRAIGGTLSRAGTIRHPVPPRASSIKEEHERNSKSRRPNSGLGISSGSGAGTRVDYFSR